MPLSFDDLVDSSGLIRKRRFSWGTVMTEAPKMPLAEHPFVLRLSRLVKLSAADLASLAAIVEGEHLVRKRQDLVVLGAEYRNLCFVSDGYAIRYKLLRSGKRQILNVI